MTPPTVSRDGPGLLVSGLHDGPHGIGRGAARVTQEVEYDQVPGAIA